MNSWVNDLKYILMPSRHPHQKFESEYQAAYQGWKAAWEKFRAEIGVKEPLSSDGFVLPDETGALFYKGEFVGMSSFTYGNLAKGPMSNLSWFKGWTEEASLQLNAISANAMIGTQFTVSPQFTGKGHIVRWKEIIFLLGFMRFDNSIADVMAGHLNLTRKVDDACGESFGATILDPCKTFDYYGVEIPAQLVAYQKHNVAVMKQKANKDGLCDELWSKLIHVSEYPVQNEILPFKKVA